jgi:lipoprotein-anchoring transpeptidase ErfK/SrfK
VIRSRLAAVLATAGLASAVLPSSALALREDGLGSVAGSACVAGAVERVGTARVSLTVVAPGRGVEVRSAPRAGAPVLYRFAARTVDGVASVFAVRQRVVDRRCRPAWFQVQVPVRPNGATGWVPAGGVGRYLLRSRIVIDVSARRLAFLANGRLRWTSPVAVGRPQTPTPIGRYYVVSRLRVTDPEGAYGPAALGLSAYSPVLTGWARGGPVGIHGTNRPESIGRNVSNGCIRLPNAVALRLLREAPAGTPVVIHP